MQKDDNLPPERLRMLAFERGESSKTDNKKNSDYQKEQADLWDKFAKKALSDKKADSLEAAGLHPNTDWLSIQNDKKSGWDEVAAEYSGMKADDNEKSGNSATANSSVEQSNAKQPVQVEQTAEAVQPDRSVAMPNVNPIEQVGDNPADFSTEQPVQPEAANSGQELSADAERDIALAKRGAENQSTFMKSSTLQHLQAQYGADRVQSLDMTSGEKNQYNNMLGQASRIGSDTDNPTNINSITGVDEMDGDFTSFGKTIDSNGLGGLMQDANRATGGGALNDELSIGQMRVAAAAGHESEMSVASDVDSMKSLDEKPRELPSNPAELKDVGEQLDAVNNQTDKTAFNPGGYGDDRAEDNLDEARAEVQAALKAQEEADKLKSQNTNPEDFTLAA